MALGLTEYGYSERIGKLYGDKSPDGPLIRARVIDDFGLGFLLVTEEGEAEAVLSGGMLADDRAVRPVAGDWVLARMAPEGGHGQITEVMPRFSELRRADTQVGWKDTIVAANFDFLMLMVSMNANFSLNRVERLVSSAWSSGGTPVLVLSKRDACEDPESMVSEAMDAVPGTDVVAISSVSDEGMEEIAGYFKEGVTCAVVGSSGVGKSTLLNCLMGREVARTAAIREADSKGRHTTSRRSLHLLPGGGLFLDTPGVRSFGLTAGDGDLGGNFPDIEELAERCRFRDCSHEEEPGCAVLGAVEEGLLEKRRYESYMKMRKEVEHVRSRADTAFRLERKRRSKTLAKLIRQITK